MEYIKIEEAALKWGLSVRRAQDLCRLGRVGGAKKFGNSWMIPENAAKPADNRVKAENRVIKGFSLIRKSPFLDMTDLYNEAGCADKRIAELDEYPESQALFAAEIAYSRGDIDGVYESATEFLKKDNSFYTVISSGMLLALVAMWKGDITLWRQAKKHIYEAPWKDRTDRDIISLSIAATELSVRNTVDFPEWFYHGRFEILPADALPAARVYYNKYLLIYAQELAGGKRNIDDISGLGLMRSQPFILEPMISQAVSEKTVIVEIYLRLLCATVYLQIGDKENAAFHLDRAILLCLPDRLFGTLVEHRRQLGLFLDERLMLADPEAAKKVKTLHKTLHEGWVKIHNEVLQKDITAKLSDREREVARLAAFGLSDEQIADRLHITKASAKSILQMARNKTGIKNRLDFGAYM